jgi:RNA polymerase sigma-70 factor (ECF subfamily)
MRLLSLPQPYAPEAREASSTVAVRTPGAPRPQEAPPGRGQPALEGPSPAGGAHVIRLRVRTRARDARRRRGQPQPMDKAKSERRAGDFATQHRAWLLAQATNLCRNATDAEDLVQDTLLRFIQTFGQLESLPPERSCEAWLVTTLTHLFYDQCRRRRVQAQGAKDPHLSNEAVVEVNEPASRPVYDTLTDEQFSEALEKLSPKMRATFEMHAAGKKYQDIARSLGIPVGTVSKRLHDARARLREFILQHINPGVN